MSFDFNIPIIKHSIIVGKGGATIKEINTKYNVTVKIPTKEQSTTLVTIVGTEANTTNARLEIEKIIGFRVSSEVLVEKSYAVPSDKHHLIVGSGGSIIQNLQKKTNTIVTVPKKELNSSVVLVLGTESCVTEAIKEIESLIGFKINLTGTSVQNHTTNKLEKLKIADVNEVLFFGSKDDDKNFKRFLQYLGSPISTLDICVFTLSDDNIAAVVLDLHKGGVKVRIITDDDCSVNLGSDIGRLRDAGVEVRMDNSKAHMHHKFAILDGKCLVNGSFNWTRQAHKENKENIVITSNPKLVEPFIHEYGQLWEEFANNKLRV